MHLSTFILKNMEPILQEWEDFARSLGAITSSMDDKALRDHAELMLRAIADDIQTEQSPAQQEAKGTGDAPVQPAHAPESAATAHGSGRADEGFSLVQMVSEYRALRASVLRLAAKEEANSSDPTPASQTNLLQMRFNEAVDEALAASIQSYSDSVDLLFEAKARRRMESLGTLAAGLGHDMANVLLPMRSCLAMLTKEGPTPTSAPHLDSLNRSVAHLGGLAKGLRALAMDPEDSIASPDSTSLHDWWKHAISPFTWTLPKGVQLHVEGLGSADPPLPPVHIPAHVLMQAVYNLVQNAAQALGHRNADNPDPTGAEPTGNIWISAERSAALPEDPIANPAVVRLIVRDDGPGMDATTVLQCTKAFFTTKPKNMSSGIGLFVVRSALERHGGKIFVESKENEGTTFTLLLPIATEDDHAIATPSDYVTPR